MMFTTLMILISKQWVNEIILVSMAIKDFFDTQTSILNRDRRGNHVSCFRYASIMFSCNLHMSVFARDDLIPAHSTAVLACVCVYQNHWKNLRDLCAPLRDRSKPTQDEKWEQPSKARGRDGCGLPDVSCGVDWPTDIHAVRESERVRDICWVRWHIDTCTPLFILWSVGQFVFLEQLKT